MSDTSLRARGVSEIVDAAFALYRRNAMEYIVVTAVATAPSLILNLLLISTPPTRIEDMWKILPGLAVGFLSYVLVGAFVSRMGSDVYLGSAPDIGATLSDVSRRIPILLGSLIASYFLLFFSAIFFLIPAVFVFILIFATVPVIVLEKKGVTAAMSRSARLTKGRKGHVFGTLALLFGIYFVFAVGFTIAATMTGSNVVQLVTGSVFGVVASPLIHLGVMVLYYDLRIRVEGFDLEHMAQSLGSAPPTAPFVGSTPG